MPIANARRARIRGIDEFCAKVGFGNSPLARIVDNMAESSFARPMSCLLDPADSWPTA
jgi:hypothetical protein